MAWNDGAHRFTELGRRLFRGRTAFVLEIPTLQVSTDRQWVDTQKEMYYPVTEETLPGVEERWRTLTRGSGSGADRQITPAFKRWVIDRLRLETWSEETTEGQVEQEIIGFGSGDLTMMYDDARPWHGSFAEYS